MADENQSQSGSGTSSAANTAQNAASTVKSVAEIAKAGVKLAAGDIVGGIKDLLANEQVRNAILAIVLVFGLITTCCSMIVGSAITAAIENLAKEWTANWEEAWEEHGIASNGSVLYQYTIGAIGSRHQASFNTLIGLFTTSNIADNGENRNNSSIEGGESFSKDDYKTTIDAITTDANGELTGANGALMKRINMIKGRVKQRGLQLQANAITQYSWQEIGVVIAENLAEYFANPVLYAGTNLEECSVNFDMSAFETTDLQALKILAMYSIQHDCDLTAIDMWDLMDYCGWYNPISCKFLETSESTIYNITQDATFGEEIGDVVYSGESTDRVYEFLPLIVPYWNGTCAPQWYYEEISQIKEHNEKYFAMEKAGNKPDDMIAWGVTDAEDDINLSKFANLKKDPQFGMIDMMFVSTKNTITVSRTEYTGATKWSREFIASIGQSIAKLWSDTMDAKESTNRYGNKICRDDNDGHSFILTSGMSDTELKVSIPGEEEYTTYQYYLVNLKNNESTDKMEMANVGDTITFTDLAADTSYRVYEETTTCSWVEVPATETEPASKTLVTTVNSKLMDSFTTFPSPKNEKAYQLVFTTDIAFAPRTIDDLALNILGLWPGSLMDVAMGADGIEYPKYYVGVENLKKTWTDKYTAPDGSIQTLSFEREYASQFEAYRDLVEALSKMLNIEITDADTYQTLFIDTSGFKNPANKNNVDLVEWAKQAESTGWGYVYGTYGKVLTGDLFQAKLEQYPDDIGRYKDFIQAHWLGGRTADCVGLIKGYSWYNIEEDKYNYMANGMPDIGANTMYRNAIEKGKINTIPEIIGLAVWKDGHIGIYIGNGEVIHAKGTKYGVVKTPITETGWTHWLKIPYISYITN